MATPEELVAKALESLSSDERQQVTAWLLKVSRPAGRVRWLAGHRRPIRCTRRCPARA